MNEKNLEKYSDIDNCLVRNILDRIGDKWSTLVMLLLCEEEVLRFNEIHKHIVSISQKMLSTTLRSLEADGLVERTIYPVVPPKVEYRLTARGKSLVPLILNLVEWADKHMDDIKNSRLAFKR